MGPIANIARWLPFRFMLSAPVELITRTQHRDDLVRLLGGQAAWAAISLAAALMLWHRGVRRFEAVGG
jgi:viologen exporter family transport system permease protein